MSQNTPPDEKSTRKRSIMIALVLFALSAFMYVSFIVKTAVKGP
jgi:flagellar basal body-associated protein FliL